MIENQSNYEESECQDESDFNNDIIEDLNENKELEINVIDNLNKINKEKDITNELSKRGKKMKLKIKMYKIKNLMIK
jgi:hypothetical protein